MADNDPIGIRELDRPVTCEDRVAALAELRALVMVFAGTGGTEAIRAINRAMTDGVDAPSDDRCAMMGAS